MWRSEGGFSHSHGYPNFETDLHAVLAYALSCESLADAGGWHMQICNTIGSTMHQQQGRCFQCSSLSYVQLHFTLYIIMRSPPEPPFDLPASMQHPLLGRSPPDPPFDLPASIQHPLLGRSPPDPPRPPLRPPCIHATSFTGAFTPWHPYNILYLIIMH